MLETVHIALGSNLGDREANILDALNRIDATEGLRFLRRSALHETEPVGPPQPEYLNAAAEIECSLDPVGLLRRLKEIEMEIGRTDTVRWGPRVIDIDIIFFGDRVIDADDLTVPHAEMAGRAFVLEPLAEIAPDRVHPVYEKTVAELLENCRTSEKT